MRNAPAILLPTGPGPRSRAGTGAALLAAASLAACTQGPAPAPPAAPTAPVAPPVSMSPPPKPALPGPTQAELRQARAEAARAAAHSRPSDASAVMAGYLQRIEDQLVARGLLSTDRAEGAPLTPAQLAEDFVQIALRDEYSSPGQPSAGDNAPAAPLRRWTGPVRMQLEFGASVPPEIRARDRQAIAGYAARLASAAGHPVGVVGEGGNFIVAVVSDDDRTSLAPRLRSLIPGLPSGDAAALSALSPQTFCTVFSYGGAGGVADAYASAVALIRAELPPRLRLACIEEELAQGLGLPNDSHAAKPSVFNDDQRQAALTRHDELLLRMLYDPRLRIGMSEAEARPIALQIAAELLGAPVPPAAPAPAAPPAPATPPLTAAAATPAAAAATPAAAAPTP